MTPVIVLAVLGAGVLGALARYGLSLAFAKRQGFPVAVLVVNIIGSALSGAVLALVDYDGMSADWRLVLLTGLAGGLTTFSTWSVETIQLIQGRRARTALASVIANLVLGFAAAAFAYLIVISALSSAR
jgi:CrcB protein